MFRRLELEPTGEPPKHGFFKKEDKPQVIFKTTNKQQPSLFDEFETMRSVPNCKKCKLDQHCFSPMMGMTGEGAKGVFILGEAPGAEEDRAGTQWIGKAGEMFNFYLRQFQFHLLRDAWRINAVNCRPTTGNQGKSNRPPTNAEINHCRPWWWSALQSVNPNFIWLMGANAIQAFFGMRRGRIFQNLEVGNWHRLCIPDPVTRAWVIPLYHPSYFCRNPRDEFYFAQEIQFAVEQLGRSAPTFKDEWAEIKTLMDFDAVKRLLTYIYNTKVDSAWDFETNCLRPWHNESRVATAGVAVSEDEGFSFPVDYPHWSDEQRTEIITMMVAIWEDQLCRKYAHSIQMENSWMQVNFKAKVQNWFWDSMVGAHIEDCRDYFTGLKKQAYLKWGVMNYGDDIDQYMRGNPFNKIMEAPLDKLLLYNGMDAKLTFRLCRHQQADFSQDPALERAYQLFHDGVIKSSQLEIRGIPINPQHYEEAVKKVAQRQAVIETKLQSFPEVQSFALRQGREADLASANDLKMILYDLMGITPTHFTKATNAPALNEAALSDIKNPFTNLIVKQRKLKKIHDYISLFNRLQVSGLLHPSFNLHTVRTYRSSSNDPNFQNLPMRNEEAVELIRRGIIAGDGNIITEVDYGSMEVRIICCYSQDPVLREELNTGVDVHSFWTEYAKDYGIKRYDIKNGFVFPLFYGSYAGNIHPDLVSRGYNIPLDFVMEMEREFWLKYHHTLEFRERQVRDYQATGYIQTLMGHRRSGLLRKTQIINTPVQATAFHCLLWSLIETDNIFTGFGPYHATQTKIRAQIHDSMWLIGPPDEFEFIKDILTRTMTTDIRAAHSWITVPLLAEFKVSEVGGNWLEMKEVE